MVSMSCLTCGSDHIVYLPQNLEICTYCGGIYDKTVVSDHTGRILPQWTYDEERERLKKKLGNLVFEIGVLASSLQLPNHVKESAHFYLAKTTVKVRSHSKSYDVRARTLVYLASRMMKTGHTLEYIAGPHRKSVAKWFRTYVQRLKLKVPPITSPPISSQLKALRQHLELPESLEPRALEILQAAEEAGILLNLSEKGRRSMIGAAIFIASTFEGVKVHQKDIAVAIGVSIATIKNRYKELITKLEISAISKNEKKKSIIECPVCGMRVSLHVPKDWKIMAKKKLVRLNVQHENHGFIIQIEDSGRISLVSDLNSQK